MMAPSLFDDSMPPCICGLFRHFAISLAAYRLLYILSRQYRTAVGIRRVSIQFIPLLRREGERVALASNGAPISSSPLSPSVCFFFFFYSSVQSTYAAIVTRGRQL